ncbi:hypothetical protein DPMN_173626 [Dreissena polymorpha]|uniref:Fibronectin type-III domain-containing protein n=1 Tax=Dreissena polymorpha TaxID=45954 RepID=A0A9D4E3T2_DREPO|nr:hypothetical protein DPMN_173626 [Dreissena polymorpha]
MINAIGLQRTRGCPFASDIGCDTITLFWNMPSKFEAGDHLQIGYNDVTTGSKWKFYENEGDFERENLLVPRNLKFETQYVFRVRVINGDEIEGPYSDVSRVFTT